MVAMTSLSTSTPVPLGEYIPSADQRVVLRELTWAGYEALLALRGDRRRPKLAYLDGTAELMTTSREHETVKGGVGALVEAFCFERRIPWSRFGNMTMKAEAKLAGVEADECYIFDADPDSKDRPDLAIEVFWTSGGINNLEIYRRLGVREVWIWKAGSIAVHVLTGEHYELHERSQCLPDIDLAMVCELALVKPMSEAAERFRATLRG